MVVAGVVVGGLLLSGNHGLGSAGGSAGTGPIVTIESAQVYLDAAGFTPDNPGEAKNVYDGNPSTAWYTDVYQGVDAEEFGGYYDGEGLAVELRGTHRLASLLVTSSIAGWSASTYVSTHDVATGSPVADWGTPTASVRDAGHTVRFDLAGRSGSWVLLWLTRLGPTDQAAINELTVRAS